MGQRIEVIGREDLAQNRYERSAAPFQWTFTRQDFVELIDRLNAAALAAAA
ncbi:MAG: hypothetical protein HYS04_01505 [Acidobacteria bacterium]|nr:hypothetical protein [Acidobacteriota bacterium]